MLRDPYYLGLVRYNGETFEGRHEALISRELFERVQEVLDQRSRRGQRDRVLTHFLKGMLFCDRCRQAGRTSRLIYTEATGRGSLRYQYFLCRGRQDKLCDLPHLAAWQVEDVIERHISTIQLPESFLSRLRAFVTETSMTNSAQCDSFTPASPRR
jgi:site-specific DNA recombinase